MSERLDREALRREHTPDPEAYEESDDPRWCDRCQEDWPCDPFRLLAALDVAEKALTTHGHHGDLCNWIYDHEYACSCGFSDALAILRGEADLHSIATNASSEPEAFISPHSPEEPK